MESRRDDTTVNGNEDPRKKTWKICIYIPLIQFLVLITEAHFPPTQAQGIPQGNVVDESEDFSVGHTKQTRLPRQGITHFVSELHHRELHDTRVAVYDTRYYQ